VFLAGLSAALMLARQIISCWFTHSFIWLAYHPGQSYGSHVSQKLTAKELPS
jgi:hypothetical protein